MQFRALRAMSQALCLALCWTTAQAGSFAVSPTRADLTADRAIAALTVRNTGDEPAVVQLQTVAWSQDHGTEVMIETQDLLASPPIFTLAPGAAQIVRIGLRKPAVSCLLYTSDAADE